MQGKSTRRGFLKLTSAGTAGAILSSLNRGPALGAVADEDNMDEKIPIVDTHQHLWDLKKFTLPWLEKDAVKSLRRSFLMSDYLTAAQGLPLVKTVYMEVNVRSDQQAREAEHVIELCRRPDNPMSAAVIGGSPQSEDFQDYITPFAKSRYVKGVRTVLHDPDRPRGLCLERQFVENIKLLGKLGLSFDLCMRPGEIVDAANLVEKCPQTRFVVDHCGNMSVTSADKKLRARWMRGMREIAGHKDVICKISGIIVTAEEDWKPDDLAEDVNFCIETFGEDRVCFAGDWPVCTLRASFRQWVSALEHIVRERPAKFRRKLFCDNAVRFYGLR